LAFSGVSFVAVGFSYVLRTFSVAFRLLELKSLPSYSILAWIPWG
jgi:hypothetical protein